MKSTSSRVYLDYNATSPLADSVRSWIANGDFLLGNPQATHTTGRKTSQLLRETRDYLLNLFGLYKTHELFFHSGTTEGANTIIRNALVNLHNDRQALFMCSLADHACVTEMREELKKSGMMLGTFRLDRSGHYDEEFLRDYLLKFSKNALVNYTWVHNETGIVWDLDKIVSIKNQTGCLVHVDATQAPLKIENWRNLSPELDAYSFSGHKFSALAGTGFTLVKKGFSIHPLIHGGGQEKSRRSGTQNYYGIYSLYLALNEKQKLLNIVKTKEAKLYLENEIKNFWDDRVKIVGEDVERNSNTTMLILEKFSSATMIMAFDQARIDVSSGSACSAGLIRPNTVLMAMGYSSDQASSTIRLSFDPLMTTNQAETIWSQILPVFKQLKKKEIIHRSDKPPLATR